MGASCVLIGNPTQLRLTSDGKLAIEKLRCRFVGANPIAPTEQLVNFVGDN
jgi:hypothetical protein